MAFINVFFCLFRVVVGWLHFLHLYKSTFPNLHIAQINRIAFRKIGPSLAVMQTILLFTIYLVRIFIMKKIPSRQEKYIQNIKKL